MQMKSIEDFESKSDKVSHHGYHRFYDGYLNNLKEGKPFKMLELGYDKGYSIELWRQYFGEKATIDSIDILDNPNNPLVNQYFKINQENINDLEKFCSNKINVYSFIIDDASHVPEHQWNSFIRLIDCLQPGGLYIIEDIETSFWKESHIYGIPFNALKTGLGKKLWAIFSYINREFISKEDLEKLNLTVLEKKALDQIESLLIGYNTLIFTKKQEKNNIYYREFENYKLIQNINSRKSKKSFFTWFRK